MRIFSNVPRAMAALVFALLLARPVLADQEALARAKEFYASASYDEALQVLTGLRAASPVVPGQPVSEVAAYQVFCLVALGRTDEATKAIEAIVHIDPLYHPSEVDASPRVLAFFENVRRPLLPVVVKQLYASAKSSLERKQMAEAGAAFDQVLALLNEIGTTPDPAVADLKTLATGFRDLSKASLAAQPPPSATPPPSSMRADAGTPASAPAAADRRPAAPVEPATFGIDDVDVSKPVSLTRSMPPWHPTSAIDKLRTFSGRVEVFVDERGKVLSAKIVQTIHRDYDAALLRALPTWTFQPARKNGAAVRYLHTIDIQLAAQ